MLGLNIVPIIVIHFYFKIKIKYLDKQEVDLSINNIKLFFIILRETTAMTIESILSRV